MGGLFKSTGQANAINELFEEAAKRGATHLVISGVETGYWSGSDITGRAFDCNRIKQKP